MTTHSSTLAWKIPWTEEPGGLQSMGSRRVGHNWVTSLSLFTFMHWRRKWQPTPVLLPGESHGQRSLVGYSPKGCRVGHCWEAKHACMLMKILRILPVLHLSTRNTLSIYNKHMFRKTSVSALLNMPKPLTVWITINRGKFWKRWEYQTTWPDFWETCMQVRKQQLELDMEQQTGSK